MASSSSLSSAAAKNEAPVACFRAKPLTFLAGAALASSLMKNSDSIDYLLLIVSLPQLFQYVLCYLKPSQIMKLFWRCHNKLQDSSMELWQCLPGYAHISTTVAYNQLHLLPEYNIFYPQTTEAESDPNRPHPIRLDSNNVDDTVLSVNMYLSLIHWSTYLLQSYNIYMLPMQRWVQDGSRLRLLLVMPMVQEEEQQEELQTEGQAKRKMRGQRSRQRSKQPNSSKTMQTFVMATEVSSDGGGLQLQEVLLQNGQVQTAAQTWAKTMQTSLVYQHNEYCNFKYWRNLGRHLYSCDSKESMDLNKFDACCLFSLITDKLMQRTVQLHMKGSEGLDIVSRSSRMGHYCLWYHGRFVERNTYWKVLNEIESLNASLTLVKNHVVDKYSRTKLDIFISRYFEFMFHLNNPLTDVPCIMLHDMSFFNNWVDNMLMEYCDKNRLLTAAGVPNQHKCPQFERPKRPMSQEKLKKNVDELAAAVVQDYYKYMKCCPTDIEKRGVLLQDEVCVFGEDSVACFLLAALNLNLLGRHHIGLVYAVEGTHKLIQNMNRCSNHYLKVLCCMCWALLGTTLNKCFAPNIKQVWECALGFAHVSDYELLLQLVQQMCLTRGCHELEQEYMIKVYIPRMAMFNSAATFVTVLQHLDLQFQKLEHMLVVLLCKSLHCNLVDIVNCGTVQSLEKEIWKTESHIRHILDTLLYPLFKMCDAPNYKLFYYFYNVKINLYCNSSVAHLDKVERVVCCLNRYNLIASQTLSKVIKLCNSLNNHITSKIRLESELMKEYVDVPSNFYKDGHKVELLKARVMQKTQLQHSEEMGHLFFLMGLYHLLALQNGRLAMYDARPRELKLFAQAVEQFEVASNNNQQLLHRLKVTRLLAQVEKLALEKVLQYIQRYHQQAPHVMIQGEAAAQQLEQEAAAPAHSPTVVSFAHVLKPDNQEQAFMAACFQDLEKLTEEEQNTNDRFYIQQAVTANREKGLDDDDMHIFKHQNGLEYLAYSTLRFIKTTDCFLNACFDVHYNH